MYINKIVLRNFRSFRDAQIDLVHPDQNFETLGIPAPRLRNVNLLLGNNGAGKTTLLKAISLACLGPAVGQSGIYPYRLIRREPETYLSKKDDQDPAKASISATFTPHDQDRVPASISSFESRTLINLRGDLENIEWAHPDDKVWHPIFSSESDAFFFVGYGAMRRVEQKEYFDSGMRHSRIFVRAQRVQSLFEDTYSLVPLSSWLPAFKAENKGRYTQIVTLLNKLVGTGHYKFTGELEAGEYLFERGGLKVPFRALSDGYRAYLGWVGDLLYHICATCPSGKRLDENQGIVMIDEIDLHLHPQWQLSVLPTLAAALPKIQFIVTSHSPLIVGSLEWMNIITMKPGTYQSSRLSRISSAVHGLDADQILLTDFFGLDSTRASPAKRNLKSLSLKARLGDTDAAFALLAQMSRGMEQSK